MKIELVSETSSCACNDDEFVVGLSSADNKSAVSDDKDVVKHAVPSLVQHYRQTIHHYCSTLEVVAPCFVGIEHDKISGKTGKQKVSLPINTPSVLGVILDRLRASSRSSTVHESREIVPRLLLAYLEHVRPLLVPPCMTEEAASVLMHYEMLIAISLQDGHDSPEYKDIHSSSSCSKNLDFDADSSIEFALCGLLRVLCSDITLQIQQALQLVSKYDSPETDNGNDEVDVPTLSVGDRRKLRQQRELRHCLTTKIMIPVLIRLLDHTYNVVVESLSSNLQQRNTATTSAFQSYWMQTQAQCVISLLAFDAGCDKDGDCNKRRLGPRQIFPACLDRIENVLQYTPCLSSLDMNDINSTTKLEAHRTEKMNWKDVELTSEEWDGFGVSFEAARAFWNENMCGIFPSPHSTISAGEAVQSPARDSAQRKVLMSGEGDHKEWLLQLAKAARANFFGRDLYTTIESSSQNHEIDNYSSPSQPKSGATVLQLTSRFVLVPQKRPTRTRLHLGRTVTEEQPSYESPYQEIPSRIHVVCRLVSLLPPTGYKNKNDDQLHEEQKVDSELLNELWPIVYELLSANREVLVALGAVCMCKLWHSWNDAGKHQQEQVAANLKLLLASAIRICRGSAVLALVALAEQVLLEMFHDSARDEHKIKMEEQMVLPRLKSLQQWLMILHKNHTQRIETSWGCLVGGVLPHLHVLAKKRIETVELGRLGLMALLPLIQMEDMGHDSMFASPLTLEVQWLALLALSNLFMIAKESMPLHGGKILSALLVCLASTSNNGHYENQRIQYWAEHVASQALVTCGDRGKHFLDDVLMKCRQGYYDDSLCRVVQGVYNRGIQ